MTIPITVIPSHPVKAMIFNKDLSQVWWVYSSSHWLNKPSHPSPMTYVWVGWRLDHHWLVHHWSVWTHTEDCWALHLYVNTGVFMRPELSPIHISDVKQCLLMVSVHQVDVRALCCYKHLAVQLPCLYTFVWELGIDFTGFSHKWVPVSGVFSQGHFDGYVLNKALFTFH